MSTVQLFIPLKPTSSTEFITAFFNGISVFQRYYYFSFLREIEIHGYKHTVVLILTGHAKHMNGIN